MQGHPSAAAGGRLLDLVHWLPPYPHDVSNMLACGSWERARACGSWKRTQSEGSASNGSGRKPRSASTTWPKNQRRSLHLKQNLVYRTI